MATRNLFGTDGVRGVVNTQITSRLALLLGTAASMFFDGRRLQESERTVAVAWDPRVSSEMLAAALGAGFMETGVTVEYLGVLPTPGLALLLANNPKYAAGAMISASHNPPEYNGIKFFGAGGRKLADADEEAIEGNLALLQVNTSCKVRGDEVGAARWADDARERYLGLLEHKNPGLSLAGLRIVVDTAHGATSRTTPVFLRRLGADVIEMNTDEDGRLINKECGSTHPAAVSARVPAEGADLGVAHDGDGDRVIMVDHLGRLVWGDIMLFILATGLAGEQRLTGNTVVGTVLTNLGLQRALERYGIRLARPDVGDRYILDRLHDGGFVLGGEESGHIINLYQNVTGDGLATTLMVLSYLKKSGHRLADILDSVELYPQIAENVRVKDRQIVSYPTFLNAVAAARAELGDAARLVVRPSGTEPLVRIFLEGQDTDRLNAVAQELRHILVSSCGQGEE
jgi:phosphoglucosamine mutase